uniref:Uncharacterized protein n=1 Tax=Skeletonema marinoi TaxID=267567 RepID=A0A7S2Q0F4_9STRA|mmetsp:Transcript_6837/g.11508  ORF Transcript_6837/g.11508 Transcript_6837/m.11508 type:complete len:187 (+) Transcript_6837:96-656(+)
MTITSMFQSSRLASKSNQNAEQNLAANAKETDANVAANANESVELKQVSFQESRDDPSLFERFFSAPSNVLSGAIAEAASIADDIQTVITAELDEEKELSQLREERELREVQDVKSLKEDWKEVEVKGSHTDLAKEIKKLGKLERILERAEKQIMKSEKQIYLTEQKQMKTRMKIKALSRKFELDE